MLLTESRLRRLFCALLVCSLAYGIFHYGSRYVRRKREPEVIKIQAKPTPISSQAKQNSVMKMCPMYQEFRNIDFHKPSLRSKLCKDAEAYKRYPDGFPMCQLPKLFDEDMLNIVTQGSQIIRLDCMNNASVQMYVYKDKDYISNQIRQYHSWEPQLVHRTLRFALKLPQVTFLDIGSNIGVYSIQAAKVGLPVVSLDANIRNLLRLRLSLNAASLNSDLVWNFISGDEQLKYLSFLADCNVGGAGRDKADLPDTVPVMPLRSERITSLIKTKNVVMKMDIQGGETDFLQMSGTLFTNYNVAAVQMEWYRPMIRGNDDHIMVNFFTSRGYKVWQIPGMNSLDPVKHKSWGGNIDIVWIHKDFQKFM